MKNDESFSCGTADNQSVLVAVEATVGRQDVGWRTLVSEA